MHYEQLLRLKNRAIERLEGSLAQTELCNVDGSRAGPVDATLDPQRMRQAIAQLQQKILRLTEQLRIEQTARDENVAEYLKLASNSDKQQSWRIKQVFEKKNQKSAASIAQLQRKLEHYRHRLCEAEHGGDTAHHHKGVCRDVQQGLGTQVNTGLNDGVANGTRGGLSSCSPTTHMASVSMVSKPREFAFLVRSRFNSADSISGEEPNFANTSKQFGSDEDCSSATSESAGASSLTGGVCGSSNSKGNSLEFGGSTAIRMLIQEIRQLRKAQAHVGKNLEKLKDEYQDYTLSLQDRFRSERLEEQLNDLTELHQNEILNLKQELASMEEKMAYQSYERARDVQEVLEACQTRIANVELQQQQQVLQLEGLENSTARALLGKFINILLTLTTVFLVFVFTVVNCVAPMMKTSSRSFSTILLVLLFTVLWKNWDALSGHPFRCLYMLK